MKFHTPTPERFHAKLARIRHTFEHYGERPPRDTRKRRVRRFIFEQEHAGDMMRVNEEAR